MQLKRSFNISSTLFLTLPLLVQKATENNKSFMCLATISAPIQHYYAFAIHHKSNLVKDLVYHDLFQLHFSVV